MNRKEHDDIKRYAAADRSDPFAYNRAMTHAENGLTRPFFDADHVKHEANYTATEFMEQRRLAVSEDTEGAVVIDGAHYIVYAVKAYKNIARP